MNATNTKKNHFFQNGIFYSLFFTFVQNVVYVFLCVCVCVFIANSFILFILNGRSKLFVLDWVCANRIVEIVEKKIGLTKYKNGAEFSIDIPYFN